MDLIQRFIQLDKEIVQLSEEGQSQSLSPRGLKWDTHGHLVLNDDDNYIYRILSPIEYYDSKAIYLLSKKNNLSFFLEQELIYAGEHLYITKQKKADEIEVKKTRLLPELSTSLEALPFHLKNTSLEKIIYRDYGEEEYKSIIELAYLLNIKDINFSNCGIIDGKVVCFDYESHQKITLEQLIEYLKLKGIRLTEEDFAISAILKGVK